MTYIPTETGHWVDEKFHVLSEIIEDYDPTMELRWIPPDNRKTLHEQRNPWAIFQRGQLVFLCSGRDEPYQILAKVIRGDQRQGDVLARMDAENRAKELIELRKQMDMQEAAQDEFAFLINNANRGKNYIKHNGRKLDGNTLRELT